MGIWQEIEMFFRDPKKFKYDKEQSKKAAEVFKKAFNGNEEKAKKFLNDMLQVKTMTKDQSND